MILTEQTEKYIANSEEQAISFIKNFCNIAFENTDIYRFRIRMYNEKEFKKDKLIRNDYIVKITKVFELEDTDETY